MKVPEQGQMVEIRGRYFLVQDVSKSINNGESFHKVSLEHLDEDRFGEFIDVIWEHEYDENNTLRGNIFTSIGFPEPTGNWDAWDRFQAFLYAIYWSTSSFIKGPEIIAPFRSGIEIYPHQLEPIVRGLQMPRVNLLIADDVGLGKTIEAGLVAQELLSRQIIRKILILCPASLQHQWKEEMESKFQLDFKIIDRKEITQLRKEYGIHVNPWNSHPRIITSIDFLKREKPLQLFKSSLKHDEQRRFLKSWDLLILDEAHNVAPSGRKTYIQDSDRTKMMKEIINDFEHRLFLTATPHNGYTHSFTALLEFLDPLRFCRSDKVDTEEVKRVMVRRLKEHIENALGEKIFPERKGIDEPLNVMLSPEEDQLFNLLNKYMDSRLSRLDSNLLPVKFALTLLKKRLLSSPLAFHNSLNVHIENLKKKVDEVEKDEKLVQRLVDEIKDDWDNDEERQRLEDDALQESTKFFTELTPEEQDYLKRMDDISAKLFKKKDSKVKKLLSWISENMMENNTWKEERLVIFTEYKDTQEYLTKIFEQEGWKENLIHLYGGMSLKERERVKFAFQDHPANNSIRVLISTDAASEGLNLQNHSNKLIHYEIPWNPNRLEQRSGRIDRHGQKEKFVWIHHFLYENNEDSEFLKTVVQKVQSIRQDLGTMGDVIAQQVEERMLGKRQDLDLSVRENRLKQVNDEIASEVLIKQEISEMQNQISRTVNTWDLYPENNALVLEEALQMVKPLKNGKYLVPIESAELKGLAYRILRLPNNWGHLGKHIANPKGERMAVTFDHKLAQKRKDVVLVHLNHPLMKKAITTFRKNIWSSGITESQKLNRVSYRILPDYKLNRPAIIAFSRLLATSKNGEKLHEEIIPFGFWISKGKLEPIDLADVEKLMRTEGDHRPITQDLGDKLRSYYPSHKNIIEKTLVKRTKQEIKHTKKFLKNRAERDANAVEKLLKEREQEILASIERQTNAQKTLADYDVIEKEQFDDDIRWLNRRLETIKNQQTTEPNRVRERFALRDLKIFPLGIVYLLPESYMEGSK